MKQTNDVMIGLEVHAQLKTMTKLFCSCPTTAAEPNTAVCPTCLGHPGSKPIVNKKALEFGVKLALALGCQLSRSIYFSRKTYFYPDMAKNFQITQYEIPLGAEGHITLDSGKIIQIKRLHLEEDPAGLIHEANSVLIDYNRSGIPLCEIVTEPDLHSPDEARELMNKLMNILLYLEIFEQDSVIKADVNVSVKAKNFTRVEIKNITGFKEIERAINYEVIRQQQETVVRETRGWEPGKGITFSMRTKETEEDYGYIIEPDLPMFTFEQSFIDGIKKQIPELPQQRAQRYVSKYKIDVTDAKIIASDLAVAQLFDTVVEKVNPVLASKWFRRELLRVLNLKNKQLRETQMTADVLVELFSLLEQKQITDRIGQQIIERLVDEIFSPKEFVVQQSLGRVADESLSAVCDKVIAENPQAVADYKNGVEKALKFLIGKAMALTKGQADPVLINKLLEEKLQKV
ncbi:Asp-tRNA(Asn)/Glu-tRNA(Gln) amidotransferase subunit GatB [Candidatus Woesearchaeota archaeon]|nr:Asp-tRNA(Asn)/Glu-tRNA(Gln) amidotransferase subunit GatB [Candidatus Woesearchaeota archaeon]